MRKGALLAGTAVLVGAGFGGMSAGSASAGPLQVRQPAVQAAATTTVAVPPPIQITTPASTVASGLLFSNPIKVYKKDQAQPWTGGPMIYDNAGHVVWYKPSPSIWTMQPITYKGQPALAYYQKTKNQGGWNQGYWVVLNQSYTQIGTIRAGNGLMADHHELTITDHGTALIDCYRPVTMDLTKYGGLANAKVWEPVLQEIDLTTGKVDFEWHGLAHIPVTDSYQSLKTAAIDYFHMNAIAVDTDGNLIVSGRHLSAVLKIDRSTGNVLWTLGGKHSSFQFLGDGGPSWQHDVRVVGPNTYSVFDNGVSRKPTYSRAVIFQIDPVTHTATVVDQWRHTPSIYTSIMGSNRLLPNGDRLVGWALSGVTTEYSGHTVVFESKFLQSASSYRIYRSDWTATPPTPPALTVHRSGTQATANASWNGATNMVGWQLLAGPDAAHLRVVKTVPYTGYQTTQTYTVAGTDTKFAVRAVRTVGQTQEMSAVVAPS